MEIIIRPGKALQKPTAEKSRPAGDENSLIPKLFPQPFGMLQDMIQIFR